MADEINIRNRIVEEIEVDSSEILDHPLNPKEHPGQQRAAMKGILQEVGIVAKLVVYRSPREGGRLVALDGHMRKNDFRMKWPCVVLDVTDDEADLIIQSFDTVGQLALTDAQLLRRLRDKSEFEDASVRVMLDSIDQGPSDGDDQAKKDEKEQAPNTVPEMELKPYEHYDSVLILCRTTYDWNILVDRLGLQKVGASNDHRYKFKVGLQRACPADRLLRMLKDAEDMEVELEKAHRELAQLKGKPYLPRAERQKKQGAGGPAATGRDRIVSDADLKASMREVR